MIGNEFDPMANPFIEDDNLDESVEKELIDFNGIDDILKSTKTEEKELLPLIPSNELELTVRVDTDGVDVPSGNFTGFDFSQEEYEDVNDNADMVKPSEFSIQPTLEAETFDDFSILGEEELKYPYIVFNANSSFKTVTSLCSGILTKGDVQLYFRPENDNKNKLIPVISIASTPINIRNLLRLAMRDSVFFRLNEESEERLARPEQFLRHIDLGLKEDDEYWNSLIEEEKNGTSSTKSFIVEDLFA